MLLEDLLLERGVLPCSAEGRLLEAGYNAGVERILASISTDYIADLIGECNWDGAEHDIVAYIRGLK